MLATVRRVPFQSNTIVDKTSSCLGRLGAGYMIALFQASEDTVRKAMAARRVVPTKYGKSSVEYRPELSPERSRRGAQRVEGQQP